MLSGAPLAGTFLKTPHYIMIEILAQSGLDFLCLDAEHAPFDRAAGVSRKGCLYYEDSEPSSGTGKIFMTILLKRGVFHSLLILTPRGFATSLSGC